MEVVTGFWGISVNFKGDGVALSMYNTDESIRGFAKSRFQYEASKMAIVISTKNTIWKKKYDGRFKIFFEEIYQNEFKTKFKWKQELHMEHRLIDDMV